MIVAKKTYFLIVLLITFCTTIYADVWNINNQWNEQWEEQYSNWIVQNVDSDLLDPIQLKVDCADLVYVVRAIFARNNNLPFLASDLNGVKVGHYSDRWNNLPTASHWTQGARFKAFLRFLPGYVSTKSFRYDTYPVEINEHTVKPGLVIYENIIASHACFIGRVNEDDIIPVEFFESSVPARVRFKKSTTLNIHIYDPDVPSHHSGIVRWNWPILQNGHWTYIPDEQMPHYSKEIYHSDFKNRSRLSKPLNQTINNHFYTNNDSVQEAINDLVSMFEEQIEFRVDLVKEAQSQLQQHGTNYQDEDFEYNYGTSSRDQRLNELMGQIWYALVEYDLPRHQFFETLTTITVSISDDYPPVTLYHLFITTHQGWINSDAYADPLDRWGLEWDNVKKQWLFNGFHTYEKVNSWYKTAEDRKEVFENYMEDTENVAQNEENL